MRKEMTGFWDDRGRLNGLFNLHPLNGPLSGTTRVSRYQKGKTNLDLTGARDSEWQWHQLGHMQVCTSLQTDNHVSTPPLSFYRPDALPAAQPTASICLSPTIASYWYVVVLEWSKLAVWAVERLLNKPVLLCCTCCRFPCDEFRDGLKIDDIILVLQ